MAVNPGKIMKAAVIAGGNLAAGSTNGDEMASSQAGPSSLSSRELPSASSGEHHSLAQPCNAW